jgi:hypothetical protein
MANVLSPFGFAQVGTTGMPPNFARAGSGNPYRIAATWATPIYKGDAVRMWVSGDGATSSAGYLVTWIAADGSAATKILVGIFQGCEYYSTSQKRNVFSNFWPGGDASGDVKAYVVDDPDSEWMVQAGVAATPFTQIYVGSTADVVVTPTGNTITGLSGMTLDTPTTTATFPFKVRNVITTPPTANGRDLLTAYNYVTVTLNNQQYGALLGV